MSDDEQFDEWSDLQGAEAKIAELETDKERLKVRLLRKSEKIAELEERNECLESALGPMAKRIKELDVLRLSVADKLENWIDKDDHFDNEGNPISAIAWGIMRLRGEEVDACFTKHGTITFRKRLKGEE
jgi:chromosome segregation ATPase